MLTPSCQPSLPTQVNSDDYGSDDSFTPTPKAGASGSRNWCRVERACRAASMMAPCVPEAAGTPRASSAGCGAFSCVGVSPPGQAGQLGVPEGSGGSMHSSSDGGGQAGGHTQGVGGSWNGQAWSRWSAAAEPGLPFGWGS